MPEDHLKKFVNRRQFCWIEDHLKKFVKKTPNSIITSEGRVARLLFGACICISPLSHWGLNTTEKALVRAHKYNCSIKQKYYAVERREAILFCTEYYGSKKKALHLKSMHIVPKSLVNIYSMHLVPKLTNNAIFNVSDNL
jgi:hypothetical protein